MIHIITGEYPPMLGGVGDYTALIAGKLAEYQKEVHVWANDCAGPGEKQLGVSVHRAPGRFLPAGLRQLDRELNATPQPRRIIVQWTPHSFGLRSLNPFLPAWLWKRAHVDKDRVEIKVHEQ